jgi:hypothetical protein
MLRVSRFLAVSMVLTSALAAACGVQFASPVVDDDFFTGIRVSGVEQTGAPMTVVFLYQTNYPNVVEVVCELLDSDQEVVKEIGRTTVPAFPNGNPDVTPMAGVSAFDFTVDAPGTFRVECYTPADEDNFVRDEIDVTQAPESTPTPSGNELPATSS